MFVQINYTCTECAIYGQNILSGIMMMIEVWKYREYTLLALTLVKIREFSAFNEV